MSDGSIVFNTKIDNSDIPKELKKVEREIEKSYKAIEDNRSKKMPLVEQSKELGVQLDAAKAKLEQFKDELAAIDMAMAPGGDPDDFIAASANRPGAEAALKESEKEVAALQKQWDSVNDKIDTYDRKIKNATADLEANKAKSFQLSAQMNSSGTKMSGAFAKARESAAKFGKQLLAIGKRVLIFSAIYSALRGIASYMGKILNANDEYRAQLAKLKGALMTAFQPIYEFVLPGVLAVLKVLTAIVQVVANIISALFGKSLGQSAKNAKALNQEAEAIDGVGSAAKDAQKSLAGFDEINTLSSPSSSGGGGGSSSSITPDFSDFNTAEYQAKIDKLTAYLSGALLALGAILAFSGANVPLGIGLIAAGAIGLASVVKANWDTMSDELKGAIATVTFLLGGALLALGAVLAFSGTNIGLGIALMVAGAIGMVTSAALNWNGIVSALQGPVGEIVAIASAALLGLGLLLALSGANIPLGIALIAAGAVGLVSVAALNWNAILEKLKTAWAGISQWFNTHVKPKLTLEYWKEKFSNIAEGLTQKIKDGINAAIALCNQFIRWLNEKMTLRWDSFSVGGKQIIKPGSFQLLNIPEIPALAKGAVLPANKPFLAMVGDQRNGTNVEAPLETIKQALAEVISEMGMDIDVNVLFSGELAQLARILLPVIEVEKKRRGGSLAGGNV